MIYYNNLEFKEQQEFEIYLLKQHLLKLTSNEELADKIILDNYNNLDGLAKTLAKEDIRLFCEYFLQQLFIPSSENTSRALAEVHYDVFKELNAMFVKEKDTRHKEEFILPRGTGKSTIVNTSVACWANCYKISTYTVVVAKTEDLLHQFISEVRKCLEFEKIKSTFGNLINTKKRVVNKEELELDNDTKIQGFTWNGQIRGCKYFSKRPSIIIVDDILKMDDILNDAAKEKAVTKYYTEILPAGDKARVLPNGKKEGIDTKFIVIGTPLAQDDFINTIREDSSFISFHRSVCNFDVDKYFSNNKHWQKYREILFNIKNENRLKDAQDYYFSNVTEMKFPTLWEGKYIPYELANDYFTKRLAFMQELMCDCSNVGEIWIKKIAKESSKWIEERPHEKTILSIDQASTAKTTSDFFAFTVLSKSNGFYLVREGLLKKYDAKTEFDRYIDKVITLLHKWKDITHVVLEQNVFKGIDATQIEQKIKADPILKYRFIQVISVYNTKNKDDRIATIVDKINSGQIIFNESDVEYNNQVESFKGQAFTAHDDAIDSLQLNLSQFDTIKTMIGRVEIMDRKLLGL